VSPAPDGAPRPPAPARRSLRPLRIGAGVLAAFALLALLVAYFPWDLLRGPLNRYVSERTGRHFAITQRLDVKLGATTRIVADGLEFANPAWAEDRFLVRAAGAEIHLRLAPLLQRRIEMPLVVLREPKLGLQIEPDGRRTWALGRDTADAGNHPLIEALVVDRGALRFVARHHGADITAGFELAPQPPGSQDAALPLRFEARGQWKRQPFTAQGRTGNVLQLRAPLEQPFPVRLVADAGRTHFEASGQVASLATLDGTRADVLLQGATLADLYGLVGVVLPDTPRYSGRFQLSRQGEVWQARRIDARLGRSDLRGELTFDPGGARPLLRGALESGALDFDDLAPLVGLPEQPRSAQARPEVRGVAAAARAQRRPPASRVLPVTPLDAQRLQAMNADVRYRARQVTHARQIPLDRAQVHIVLKDGVLLLDPLELGVAGGAVAGRLRVDGNQAPAAVQVRLDVRGLEINRLFPRVQTARTSFGRLHGGIDLKGRGNSVAQMLGGASGDVALMMGRGQISNLLLEVAGLDGGEIIKFLLRGDQQVALRCAAAAFDVRQGQMDTRALVLDTVDTVIYGDGGISLSQESFNLTLRPYPKDASILSLRSPLRVTGSFRTPRAGPEPAALAGRAGAALALAAVNPLLALAATIETGPGEDVNCGAMLREAASPEAAARVAAAQAPPPAAAASEPSTVRGRIGRGLAKLLDPRGRPGADYPLDPPRQRAGEGG